MQKKRVILVAFILVGIALFLNLAHRYFLKLRNSGFTEPNKYTRLWYAPDKTYTYRFSQKSQGTIIDAQQGEQSFLFTLAGQLQLEVVSLADEQYLLLLKVTGLEHSEGLEQGEKGSLIQELSKGLAFSSNDQGQIREFYLSKAVQSPKALNILKSLAIGFNYTYDQRGILNSSYSAMEQDLNGEYQAKYSLSAKEEKIFLKRQKLKYLQVDKQHQAGEAGMMIIKILPGSETLFSFDDEQKYLSEVHTQEKWLTKTLGSQIESIYSLDLSLSGVTDGNGKSDLKEKILGQIDLEKKFAIPGGIESPAQLESIHRQILGGKGRDELLAEVNSLDFKSQGDRSYQLFRQLKAWFFLNPGDLKSLEQFILTLSDQDQQYAEKISLLAGVLAQLDSHQGEEVLLSLMQVGSPTVVQQALAALGDYPMPSKKGRLALTEFIETTEQNEAKTSAILALGGMAYQLKKSDRGEGVAVEEYLLSEWQKAPSLEEKSPLLSGLGNAGAAALTAVAANTMTSPDAAERGRIIYELRKVNTEDSLRILMNTIVNDASVEVATEALKALEYHHASEEILIFIVDSAYKSTLVQPTKISMLNVLINSALFDLEKTKEFLTRIKDDAAEPDQVRKKAEEIMLLF